MASPAYHGPKPSPAGPVTARFRGLPPVVSISREVYSADDDEERRPRPPPERRPGRPRGQRQDDARRATPLSSRRRPAPGPRGRRDGPSRLRARGTEAQGIA